MGIKKIISPAGIGKHCDQLRNDHAQLVFTNGIFDLLHPGHIEVFYKAREMGTHLVVALNSDESTRRLKGKNRPLIPLEFRLEVVAALEAVDVVTWFEEDTPGQIISKVRPSVLVKGGDWKIDQIVGKDFVESYGGKVLSIPLVSGFSTSSIVKKIAHLPNS